MRSLPVAAHFSEIIQMLGLMVLCAHWLACIWCDRRGTAGVDGEGQGPWPTATYLKTHPTALSAPPNTHEPHT